MFTFSALLLTSPLSCLARFIVLWDIRNLSIIDCEQNLTTIADSKLGSWENVDDDWGFIQIGCFYVKEPVLVIKWWGGQRRGGVLRRWWRLEIALRWKFIMDVDHYKYCYRYYPYLCTGIIFFFPASSVVASLYEGKLDWEPWKYVISHVFKILKEKIWGKNQEECMKEKKRLHKSKRT